MYRDTIQNMSETELHSLIDILNEEAKIYGNQELDTDADHDEVCDYVREQSGLFDCIEDDILDTFRNGTYSFGATQMIENNIQPRELIAWLTDQREERGEAYYADIDLLTVISITESYNQAYKLG